ncbi:MAG: YXWGXW repeat-containing protein, partial [Gemmatimonadaceae bacterium]|nr:YXWGXW repeat-containing protein [Gemmatimonadaceae bacterium]
MKNMLKTLVIGTTIAAAASGCVVRGSARARFVVPQPVVVVEVDEAPPPPRTVVVQTKSGFLWVDGRWMRNGNRWDWRDGYWERERANQRWEQGRWEQRGNRHVWVDGRWSAGASVH